MSQFHGVCSHPHGASVSAGLLLASCSAFALTTYAVASCRFMALEFSTDQGSFEGHFATSPVTGGQWKMYKASIGLFQWLRPIDPFEWTQGVCVGYQESMLAVIQDDTFDVARSFAVISVLMGLIATLWSFLSSCIAWNWLQLTILRVLLLVGTVSAGLSLLIVKSNLCDQALPDGSCQLDEGAMVLIAGIILWLAAFLIAISFVRAFSPYEIEMEGTAAVDDVEKARLAGAIAARRAAAIRAHEVRRKQLAASNASGARPGRRPGAGTRSGPSAARSPKTPDTIKSFSYESDDDSINSFQQRQKAVQYLKQQQRREQARQIQSRKRAKPQTVLTVDDVSQRNELEVYISQKMQRIAHLMEDDDSNTKSTQAEI